MWKTGSGIAAICIWGATASAEVRPETDALLQSLRVPDLIEIMREEGLSYGATLEDELFAGRGGPGWSATVSQTYDTDWMYSRFAERFDSELDEASIAQLSEFFESDRGERITELEISARRALLDDTVEDAAIAAYEDLRSNAHQRLAAVEAFVEVNDLIEQNVMGAMNANYAFYVGLIDGNAFPGELSEDQILSDVWSQEEEIRDDTTEWIFSYLVMAYEPLSDEDLEIYVAFSESRAGRDLNRALFSAFDEIFVDISRSLGASAARFMAGQDI